ncbi:MAG: hypothetical protein WAT79_03540 [Saprospiraceae bacterium]
MNKIYFEEIMQDHYFEEFDFSVLRIVEYIWENRFKDQFGQVIPPQKSKNSEYVHNELKIIVKNSDKNEIIFNFNAAGIIETSTFFRGNVKNCWHFQYDILNNLISRVYKQNGIEREKYLYLYNDKSNLMKSIHYTDRSSGAGAIFLQEEFDFIYNSKEELYYSEIAGQYKFKYKTYYTLFDEGQGRQKLVIDTLNDKMESVLKIEKTVDKYGNGTSRLHYEKGKYTHGIFVDYKYDKCGNLIERKVFNDQQIVLSLVKREIEYK